MKPLNYEQTENIQHELAKMGLKLHVLKDEILDHVCSAIENKLEEGVSFEEAKIIVLKEFHEQELLDTQKATKKIIKIDVLKRKLKAISSVAAVLMLIMVVGADAQNRPEGMPVNNEEAKISSKYGKRKDPTRQTIRFHHGIDIKTPVGTPIVATANGKVVSVDENAKTWGKRIIIEHGDNFETRFCHLSEFKVSEGDIVLKGDIIGLSGNTGRSTGPHLHYEILENGKKVNPGLFLGK